MHSRLVSVLRAIGISSSSKQASTVPVLTVMIKESEVRYNCTCGGRRRGRAHDSVEGQPQLRVELRGSELQVVVAGALRQVPRIPGPASSPDISNGNIRERGEEEGESERHEQYKYKENKAVLWIRDILVRIRMRILGSVPLPNGYLCLTDPDPDPWHWSVLVTNRSGYGSRRPKNIRVLRIRIRIHNTGIKGGGGWENRHQEQRKRGQRSTVPF